MEVVLADQSARETALDTARSFIIQAPAGSGKTSLLIARYLKLLANAAEPEEIIAITFTRKATAEMRNRIMQALEDAQGNRPDEPYEVKLWQLGKQVLQRDAERGWQLALNPGRLRILTIDALTSRLVRMLPLLSRSGGMLTPVDDARPLYREAARKTLLDLDSRTAWSDSVSTLLLHLDNNFERVEKLIAEMLSKRDQWLRLFGTDVGPEHRETLETALSTLVSQALASLKQLDRSGILERLGDFAHYSAGQLVANDKDEQPWSCFLDGATPPRCEAAELPRWQALTELAFTKSGTLRKSINVNQGFPTGDDGEKERFLQLLEELAEHPALHDALLELRKLPSSHYQDAQWELLREMIQLLVIAALNLQIVFTDHGKVDHIEIARRAVEGLGDEDNPTDLALMLDYKIQHLLVDEFQDTSHIQYQLLQRLTMGWAQDDGKTLFCVGDPMQSIYRFREADVGLYLDACEGEIGQVQLEYLQLTENFRSTPQIVDWVNEHFLRCFPSCPDKSLGAVPFSPSTTTKSPGVESRITVHPFNTASKEDEAIQVAELVRETEASYPEDDIAILVRSRSHLDAILPALRSSGIRFRVTDTEQLGNLPVVIDIRSLLRAYHLHGDRLAWFSLLRAPWCGLLLDDLVAIATALPTGPLWPAIHVDAIPGLSTDGQQRLQRFTRIVAPFMEHTGRKRLRLVIEGLWVALGGRDILQEPRDLYAAKAMFNAIEENETAGRVDLQQLDDALAALYAPPDPEEAAEKVEILTMHKAKGLEYDTVIIPGLGRISQGDSKSLLQYQQLTDSDGEERLLLTGIEEKGGEQTDTISTYIQHIKGLQNRHEAQRLLYVATTRARKRLHLLGHVRFNSKDEMKPASGSLLAELWPVLQSDFDKLQPPETDDSITTARPAKLLRLPANWTSQLPQAKQWQHLPAIAPSELAAPEFLWAGELARHIGTVVHGMLERIANERSEWDLERIDASAYLYRNWLQSLGVESVQLDSATRRVGKALVNTLMDKRGQWILHQHESAHCEYALTVRQDMVLKHLIIDRMFTDEKGDRWIVDYKSGDHQEDDVDAFLDNEVERYREQLHRYWHALYLKDGQPSRLALYFPMLQAWREVEPPAVPLS